MAKDEDVLDILGQLPNLSIYTQVCMCYTLPASKTREEVVDTLNSGLQKLADAFPWIAARVHTEGAGGGSTGTNSFKPHTKLPRLVVKESNNEVKLPTMQQLIDEDFPIAMLDEADIAPIMTIPALDPDNKFSKDSPIFILQATFIEGGLLLTFLAEHRTMDGTGQGQMLYLLSKACRGEEFTSVELSSGNMSRKNLIPLLDSSCESYPEIRYQVYKKTQEDTQAASDDPKPPCQWANFSFSSQTLHALKTAATRTMPATAEFVSSDDALTAFIWQSVARARLARLKADSEISFARAVDVRQLFQVPSTYPGMIQNMTYETINLQELIESSLGTIAFNLRQKINPETSTLYHGTRCLATMIDQTPDRSVFSLTANFNFSKDLMLSSWSRQQSYSLDFGLGLGTPIAVRRPQFTPVESLAYLLPRRPSKEVVLAICLRVDDLEKLKEDEIWKEHATYIG